MFGLEWNAAKNQLSVTPSLPAQWNAAKVSAIPVGNSRVALELKRNGMFLSVRLTSGATGVRLTSHASGARVENGELRIPLPAVEVGIAHGLPQPGAITSQMKVLDQRASAHELRLKLAAPANTRGVLFLRVNDAKARVRAAGAEISVDSTQLNIRFPGGSGYVEQEVTLSW
jgi:hypothetical protein